jgi:hypothetical protein
MIPQTVKDIIKGRTIVSSHEDTPMFYRVEHWGDEEIDSVLVVYYKIKGFDYANYPPTIIYDNIAFFSLPKGAILYKP